MLVADRLQVTAVAGVADQRLVALGELALQRGDDGSTIGGVLLGLLMVAADDVAKQLWTVEQTFRTAKHLLSTRPIFHKLDETIRGHVFCSFLALALKKALEDRIAALGRLGSWPETIADLDSLTETEIAYDSKRFIVRSAPRPAASLALRAAGVALPPTVRDATAS